MDHHQQHHEHHRKEREEKKRRQHEHDEREMAQVRTIHPLWFLVLGIVLTVAVIFGWSLL